MQLNFPYLVSQLQKCLKINYHLRFATKNNCGRDSFEFEEILKY